MKQKLTHFRVWKSGKKWLYTMSLLVVIAGATQGSVAAVTPGTPPPSIAAQLSSAASAAAREASSFAGLPAGLQSVGDVHRTSEAQSAWNSTNNAIWANVPSPYNIKDSVGNTVSIGDKQARATYGTDYNYPPIETPQTAALQGLSLVDLVDGVRNLGVTNAFVNGTLTFTSNGQAVYHVDANRAVGYAQGVVNLEMAQLTASKDAASYYSGNASAATVNHQRASVAATQDSMNASAMSLVAQGNYVAADSTFAASNQLGIQALETGLGNPGAPSRAYANAQKQAAILANAADVAKRTGMSDDVVGALQIAALDANNWMTLFAKDYFAGSGYEPVAIDDDFSLVVQLVDQGKLPISLLNV